MGFVILHSSTLPPGSQANRPSGLITLPADSRAARTPGTLSAAERTRIQEQIDTLQKDTSTDVIRRLFTNGQLSLLRAKLDNVT